MKEEYILYLDESELSDSGTFAIAGFAIKKDNIELLEEKIRDVKKLIWNESYILTNNPILHCTEFRNVFENRNLQAARSIKGEYKKFLKRTPDDIEKIYYQVYGRLSSILKETDATVFSCIIKTDELANLFFFKNELRKNKLIDDKYHIALQKIIENFTHYLSINDGYGDVVYESRNTVGENSAKSPDVKMINAYHKIQANSKGITYTNFEEIQNRNRTITVHSKNENVAGLQLADFIAYNIIKFESCKKVKEQVTDFMKQIHKLSYNGGYLIEERDLRSFWGMQVIPEYTRMDELLKENKTLINALKNIKKDRNKLSTKVKNSEKRISELEEQIRLLKTENKDLKD